MVSQSPTAMSPARARFAKKWTSRLVAFGEFIDGYDLLCMGAAILFITPYFNLGAWYSGALTATAFVGTAIGMLIFGDLSDRFGRRKIFMINLAFFVVASVLSACVTNVGELFVARFVIGLAVGMDIPTSQAFLAEISPNKRRGRLSGSLPNLMWLIGAIASILVSLAIEPFAGNNTWRWLFGLAAIPAAFVFVIRRFLPESPRWLLNHGREEEAKAVFAMLDLDPEDAVAAPVSKRAERKAELANLFKGNNFRRLAAVTGFFALQSFAGAVATVAGPMVLKSTGLDTSYSLYFTGFGYVMGLVAVIVGAKVIDKVNRRVMGMWTCSVLFLLGLGMAVFGSRAAFMLVILYVCYSLMTWFGPGVLAWVWSSEAFPTQVRAVGSGIAQCVTRLAIALNVVLVPFLLARIGLWTIALYALGYLCCVLIAWRNPWLATTGKSLEEASGDLGANAEREAASVAQ